MSQWICPLRVALIVLYYITFKKNKSWESAEVAALSKTTSNVTTNSEKFYNVESMGLFCAQWHMRACLSFVLPLFKSWTEHHYSIWHILHIFCIHFAQVSMPMQGAPQWTIGASVCFPTKCLLHGLLCLITLML